MPPITPAPTDIPSDEMENESSAIAGNHVVALSDSDSMSDSENTDHNGYELLSQDPGNLYCLENDEEECSSASDAEDSVPFEVNSVIQNSPSPSFLDPVYESGFPVEMPVMDEEHVETIKAVMKGITLPSSNLPQWASLVPEEEWKAALFSEMKARQAQSSKIRIGIQSNSSSNNNKFDIPNVLR